MNVATDDAKLWIHLHMLLTILPASQQFQITSTVTNCEITADKFGTRSTWHKEQILRTNVKADVNNNVQKTVAKPKSFVPNRMKGLATLE